MSHWLTQIACGHTRGVTIVGKSESRSTMEKPEFELGGERKRAWLRRRVNATNEAYVLPPDPHADANINYRRAITAVRGQSRR